MLKKEISEVIKQTIFSIPVVLLLPGLLIVTTIVSKVTYFDVFFPLFQFGLFFWALFMGGSLLSFDQEQRGMEYLLSLPYSRLKLIFLKILPRLASVIVFYLAFVILYKNGGENVAAFSFLSFTIIYFSIYLIALSFSASSDNFVILFTLSATSLIVYFGLLILAYCMVMLKNGLPIDTEKFHHFFTGEFDIFLPGMPVAIIILLVPLLISFFLSFRKFDIRPSRTYNKRYFKYFTPIFTVGLITTFLSVHAGADIGYKDYHLTLNQNLIEEHNLKIKIHERDNVHELKDKYAGLWIFLEEDEYVYARTYENILRLNTSDYTIEILYKIPRGKWISSFWGIKKYKQTIAFSEISRRGLTDLVLIEESSKKITRIPFDKSIKEEIIGGIIFGADEIDGNRFWLLGSLSSKYHPTLLRVWEDGNTEIIGKSLVTPCYVNRMLITYSENELIILKEKQGKFEIVHKIPDRKGYRFGLGFHRYNLNNIQLKEIYGWKSGLQFAKLDLENFEIKEIGKFNGYLHCFYPDDFYLVEWGQNRTTVKIYEYEEGNLKLLKDFDFDMEKAGNRFHIFRNGIIFKKGSKVKIYSLPDLNELKFKKL